MDPAMGEDEMEAVRYLIFQVRKGRLNPREETRREESAAANGAGRSVLRVARLMVVSGHESDDLR